MLLDASGYETGTGAGVTARFRFTLIESGRPLSKVFYRREDGVVDKIASAQLAEGYAREFAVGSLEELNALLNRLTGKQAAIWGVTGLTGQVKVVAEKYRGDGEITRTLKYFAWPAGPGFLMIDLDRPEQPEPDFYYPEREAAVAALRSLHPVFTEVPILWRPSASSGVEGEGIKGQRLYVPVRDARLISEASGVLADLQWLKGWGRIELAKDGSPLTRGLIDTAPWQPNWLDFVGPPVLRDGIRRDPPPAFIDPGLLDSADLSPLLKLDTKALRREADALRDRAKQAKAREAMAVRTAYKRRTGRDYLPDDPLNAVQTLGPDHVLEDRHGDRITVGELLADPERWHGVQLRDPLEPDYRGGSLVAKAFLVNCQPLIVSYAHGKKRYRLHDPERDFAGLETVEEAGREGDGAEEEDPAEAPVQDVLAMLRAKRRSEATAELQAAAVAVSERTRVYATVSDALADPAVGTVHAPTGTGKTFTLEDIGVQELTTAGHPPSIIICATKDEMGALVKKIAKKLDKKGRRDDLQFCAKVLHNVAVDPLRNKDGTYRYRLILCTYGAVHRIGAALSARGRLLRLLAGVRLMEEKRGLSADVFDIYADEGDAGVMRSVLTIPLGYMTRPKDDKITEGQNQKKLDRCPGSECAACTFHPFTYAAEVHRGGVDQLAIDAGLRYLESAMRLDLPWVSRACGETTQDGNYHFARPMLQELPDILGMETRTSPDGTTRTRINPEGQIADWLRVEGATIRWQTPIDRNTGAPIDPKNIPPDAEVQYPSYPCRVRHAVSWDVHAFRDLAELAGAPPKYLSASWGPGTLSMLDAAHGPRVHARVLTPDERKMNFVHLSVAARLDVTEELAERLVKHSRVLLVVPTKREAKKTYDVMKQWASDLVNVSLFIEGGFTVNEYGHNFTITYPRSSLVRGANMGHYNTVIVYSNVHGAMLHELGFGFNNIRAAVEEGRRTNIVQPAGRITRPNELETENGFLVEELRDDFLTKHVILITQEDPSTGVLLDDGKWLREKFTELSARTSMTTFQVYPKRAADAHEELFTSGEVLTTDAIADGITADKLSPRQRRLTREDREVAKREARRTRVRERLDALAEQRGPERVPWHEARQRTHLERYEFSPDEIASLRDRYYERS